MGTSDNPTTRRFTTDEALRMVEVGILREDEPLELLDGVLVQVTPPGPQHASATVGLAERLRALYRGRFGVREEKPLTTGTHSLPEPDIAVVRGDTAKFALRHPTGPEAVLVVEIAWTSQRENRRKAAIYAAGAVEVYWLLDLAARKLEVRTMPVEGAYQVTRVLSETELVAVPESQENWLVRDLLI